MNQDSFACPSPPVKDTECWKRLSFIRIFVRPINVHPPKQPGWEPEVVPEVDAAHYPMRIQASKILQSKMSPVMDGILTS